MGSLGGREAVKKKKAMWLYPKMMGVNPPERWGHSACFSDGVLYVFGGCCGGMHFNDVLTLNLNTMTWSSLTTTGDKPGFRDSHSAAIIGQRMAVFGGTNGTKKVNDLHILDLRTNQWSKPACNGTPPSPRESHTATIVGEDKLVIFGGSGEGEANYLNDVHVLDLKTMAWTSPEMKGDIAAPRDSHAAVAVGKTLLICGGDCADRYHGEVDVLDTGTMSWSRLMVQGSASPGVRAGHAAVTIGTKVYIIGGVGDKQYYNDVWVLDMATCVWAQLYICGQQPQGRFSHTAVVANADIAIYGGCGEDERPLNELLILQLGSEHPNGRYNISMCKNFGNRWSQEKRKFLRADNLHNNVLKNGDSNRKPFEANSEQKNAMFHCPDNLRAKRKIINDCKVLDMESEQEEHSLSLSQNSSPSQSDQEQNTAQKLSSYIREDMRKAEVEFMASDRRSPPVRPGIPALYGAEVHGTVDGAFDSGYLITANVKGHIFRGVLFTPGPSIAGQKRLTSTTSQKQSQTPSPVLPIHVRPPHLTSFVLQEGGHHHAMHLNAVQAMKVKPARLRGDLQDVVLTLGGPGGCSHGGI